MKVAPRVGAWIETYAFTLVEINIIKSHPVWVRGLKQDENGRVYTLNESHPVWVRGLKLLRNKKKVTDMKVAPRVGAWIETYAFTLVEINIIKSHPVWVRGLKLECAQNVEIPTASHPVWVRGLKP